MLTSDAVRQLAGELERIESHADPDGDRRFRDAFCAQLGFVAGWIEALRDFATVPDPVRLELIRATEALERAADRLVRTVDTGGLVD